MEIAKDSGGSVSHGPVRGDEPRGIYFETLARIVRDIAGGFKSLDAVKAAKEESANLVAGRRGGEREQVSVQFA